MCPLKGEMLEWLKARLESVYTPKVYRGFESRSLRIAVKGQKVENN